MQRKLPERTIVGTQMLQGIRNTQELLLGKWKTSIVGTLYYKGKLRFIDLRKEVNGISPKVLSKELKDLEFNHLVTRSVYDTMPVIVEYEITKQGKSLHAVLEAMGTWGFQYRQSLLKRKK